MKRRWFFFINNDTHASHPGDVIFNPLVWAKYYPREVGLQLIPLIGSLVLGIFLNPIFFLAFLYSAWRNFRYWMGFLEHFQGGDSNGGIVVSVNPNLLAVRTDLTKGFGEYPIVKIIEFRTLGPVNVGDRFPTVALYQRSEDPDLPHWEDFFPLPMTYATDDSNMINRALINYGNAHWEELESGIQQLPTPFEPGIYQIDEEESDW